MKLLIITRKPGNKPIKSLGDASNYLTIFLKELGIKTNEVSVIDYSYIENVIDEYKPTHVIIESIFAPPIIFLKLINLYKGVKWYIRIHSDVGFFFTETFGMQWIRDYQKLGININIAVNNINFAKTLSGILERPVVYLPNLYPINFNYISKEQNNEFVDIGCFGALRQMKNHGYQAMASILMAQELNKKCRFHINISPSEYKKNSVITNLRGTFRDTNHELIEHQWSKRKHFVKLIQTMDIGTQISYSESFNFVVADFIINGVPIAASKTIDWVNKSIHTSTFDMADTIKLYKKLYKQRNDINFLEKNLDNLKVYINKAKDEWISFINLQG